MIWQKHKNNYHLLRPVSDGLQDGAYVKTVCNVQIVVKRKDQLVIVTDDMCPICNGVWHLVYTSVADAMQSVRRETNQKVLDCAAIATSSSTLLKAINARIRKLQKDALRDKKLRLIEKAYD
jgi:Zn-finger nucleic acid-binding protein